MTKKTWESRFDFLATDWGFRNWPLWAVKWKENFIFLLCNLHHKEANVLSWTISFCFISAKHSMQTLSSPPCPPPIITNNNNNKHFLSLLLTHSKLCSNSISTRRCRYKNSVKHLKQFLWNFREYFFLLLLLRTSNNDDNIRRISCDYVTQIATDSFFPIISSH